MDGPQHAGSRPRILILYASCGAGHKRAAEAVELALRQLCPTAYLRRVDALALATRPFRHCYGQMYLDFIDAAPKILGIAYSLMDRPRPANSITGWERLRGLLEMTSLSRLVGLLQSEPWDLVINTHFLPGEIIAHLSRKKQFTVPQVMVTTDFETHRLWITEPCAHYFTATEEAALYLEKMGVPPERVSVRGIPIHPVFSKAKDRTACRARHGLVGDRPVVLQLSGGCGVGRIEELYRAILEVQMPLEVVAITAHNEEARKRLHAIAPPPRHRVHILGFTTEIDELMGAADLLVSKPGGLTTSEALARGVPLVAVDPIPGQEERNCDFLLEQGAAIKVSHLLTFAEKVTPLLRDPAHLEQMRANGIQLGRPRAAFEVAEKCLELIGVHQKPRGVPQPVALSQFLPPPTQACSWPESSSRGTALQSRRDGSGEPSHVTNTSAGVKRLRKTPTFAERCRRVQRSSRGWFDVLMLGALRTFARLWHRCSSDGQPTVPVDGAAIVVANHANYSDPAFLLATCLRPLSFLHARASFDTFGLHQLFARAGSIPVRSDGNNVGAVGAALNCLQQGKAVCVFPEGDVYPNGHAPRLKRGAAFLALRSKAPVFPACIRGGQRSGKVLRDWLWPSKGVQVVYGPAVDLSAYYDRPITHQLLEEVTALLMKRVEELRTDEP